MGMDGDSPVPPPPKYHTPTCQDSGQIEEADAQDAMHHLQGHPNHQLQERVEPQLLQPAQAAREGTPQPMGVPPRPVVVSTPAAGTYPTCMNM